MESSKNILTVSQISSQIRNCLESNFSSIWIKGEISNFIAHSSGHWYFSLKDESSQIKGVMFKGQNQSLSFRPQTGEEILVRGQISLYPPRGDYQILCYDMEVVGSGLLQRQFDEIKKKLQQEGLFDSDKKKVLPLFPKHIGLITSPTGAAVRDILQILNRRFKSVRITLIPALVQGDQAPSSLLNALDLSKKLSLDVIIIGRGGGSMEDLWAFNDETLARAIANHLIPVISAVGHEIDFTICDFVADLRAPTPSAAAELVVQNAEDLLEKLGHLKKQLYQGLQLKIDFFKDKLMSLEKALIHPKRYIQDFSQKLDELSLRLTQNIKQFFQVKKQQVSHLEKLLLALNPKQVMERGFSIVTNKKGDLIFDSKDLKIKDILNIDFFKGQVKAEVKQKE
ncbi:MAG: exodeoxyribonuclease VII large subunit [Bdellovibrionaceae bacterium]|nr:exodeoxyribonuclease VII large subunit [Pseudobdellovibrionaceae bacterium]